MAGLSPVSQLKGQAIAEATFVCYLPWGTVLEYVAKEQKSLYHK
jgi:hypothetical protein